MKPELWRRAEKLYYEALECQAGERLAFLDRVCAGDEALWREVDSLLAAHEQAGGFLAAPAIEAVAKDIAAEQAQYPGGRWISHYQILSRLGAGGMGEVYLAARADDQYRKQVAIKIVKRGMVTDSILRRFRKERQILAGLDHPNIARLFDGGTTEEGLPYFVMEYIEGKPIDEYCDTWHLSVIERIKLFRVICSAVHYAHQRQIVHRDIKPGNILITPEGIPKLLDFGIAKIVSPASSSQAEEIITALRPMTLAYASPEQVRGEPITPASDVYSMGVLLYELLTGRQPYRLDSSLPYELVRVINEQEPEKPSSAIGRVEEVSAPDDTTRLTLTAELLSLNRGSEPEKLRRRLAGDLDDIVLMALRKEPARRYDSVEQFSEDIHRHLAGLPVKARKDTLAYRTGKFIRRHALGAVATILILLAVALTGGLSYLWISSDKPNTAAPESTEPLRAVPLTKVVPFTSFAGREFEPALSPDGKQVAFVWNGEKGDNLDVYVKLIDAGTPLRLTLNPGEDRVPAWSPDGRYIAFCRRSERGAEIFSVPAVGGPERKLGVSELSWPASGYYLAANPFGLAWSPNGKWLAIVSKSSVHEPNRIALLSTETADKQEVTNPPEGYYGDWLSAFSPDGKTLAFVRVRGYQVSDLYVVALSTGGVPAAEPKRLTFDERDILGLDWIDDQSLVFSSNRGGNRRLWKVATSGRPPEQLPAAGDNAYSFSISRRKRLLVYTSQMINVSIWRIAGPGENQTATRKGLATKLMASTREDWAPQFSPDGKRIAFKSTRSGSDEVWVCNSDGSHPMQLTSFGGDGAGMPRWSSDGERIAFFSRKEGHADIYVISAAGGLPRRLTTEHSDESFPSWSRDGRWIYFGSNRGGTWQVWKMPVEGGPATQITQNGGMEAFESDDEKSVYYTKRGMRGVWHIPVEHGEEARVLDRGVWGAWALVKNGIYVLDSKAESGPAIEFFDLATRRLSQIASLPKDSVVLTGSHAVLAVSPDESSVLYVQLDRVESDLIQVEDVQ
jgi:Tol biopolymer transport system component/serine/threonine protein kinase